MKKIFIFILFFTACSGQVFSQKVLWEEVFDSTNILSSGWSLVNNDSSAFLPGFFHPFRFVNLGEQNAQKGTYFFKFNFEDANSNNVADDWLITPELFGIHKGDSISFWCGAIDNNYKDSFKVWISTTGNHLSDFRLIDYFKVDGPVGSWHKKSYDLSSYAGRNIYFAVNYYIKNGGPLGGSSDNAWLDHFKLTGKGFGGVAPLSFELQQNFPNPFNPLTEIGFSLPSNSNVNIKIYDTSGKEILTLVNGFYERGKYSVSLDGNNLSSGIYFYKMTATNGAGSFTDTRKLELIK